MIRKKHGSTLITTVVLISLIGVVGSSILSLSVGDYRHRISDSEKLQNLYSSDSGLDVAYDIMVANFDMAGNFAKFKVEQLKNGKLPDSNVNAKKYNELLRQEEELLNNSSELSPEQLTKQKNKIQDEMNKLINSEFKRNFKLFLFGTKYANEYGNEYVPNQLISSIETREYMAKMSKGGSLNGEDLDPLTDEISASSFYKNNIFIANYPDIIIEATTSDSDKSEAKDEKYDREQKFMIRITSSFTTKEGEFQNKKQIEATYSLTIPNYSDIAFRTQDYVGSDFAGFSDKGITVFGNMQVKNMNNSTLKIVGDVFVQGDMDKRLLKSNGDVYETYGNVQGEQSSSELGTDVSNTHITEKYQGGITLGSNGTKTTIDIDGSVITRNTLNISKNVNLNISQNIYANNVYTGLPNGGTGDNVKLTMSSDTNMILNNDLTIKSTNTNVKIDNFYGINDKNDTSGVKEQKSSSIIVNTKEDSSNSNVEINKKAYIMGVAFIDTTDSYQTGESLAIRGNYEAYSNGGDINSEKIQAEFDDKAKYFVDYWNSKGGVKDGGIRFNSANDVHSVGATIVDGKAKEANITLDDLTNNPEVGSKQREYAVNVYNFGENLRNQEEETKLYQNPTSASSVKSTYFKIGNINENESLKKFEDETRSSIGLFNKNNAITIVIKGSNPTVEKYGDESKYYVLDGSKLSGFIATAGNVIIDGEVNFSGNIIAEGNLVIMGAKNKTIKYDSTVAERLSKSNPEIFSKVFKVNTPVKNETVSNDSGLEISYDLNKFLKQSLWQIKKN